MLICRHLQFGVCLEKKPAFTSLKNSLIRSAGNVWGVFWCDKSFSFSQFHVRMGAVSVHSATICLFSENIAQIYQSLDNEPERLFKVRFSTLPNWMLTWRHAMCAKKIILSKNPRRSCIELRSFGTEWYLILFNYSVWSSTQLKILSWPVSSRKVCVYSWWTNI